MHDVCFGIPMVGATTYINASMKQQPSTYIYHPHPPIFPQPSFAHMSYVLLNGGDPGIALAWIAGTMGVKANRSLKNKLQQVHIPRVCEAVSVLATKDNHLRLTSNLLYGLSLIFKQKVTVMESEVLDVNFRLQTPLFGGYKDPRQLQVLASTPKIAMLKDDIRFHIETDFVQGFALPYETPRATTLEEMLVHSFGPAPHNVEETPTHNRDKDVSTDFANDTNIPVDFEFDLMGNIVDPQLNDTPLLELLDTQEDFVANKPVIDDISKSLNSVSYDPHFTTTLDLGRLMVSESRPTKKRKLKLLVDDVMTFSPLIATEKAPKPSPYTAFQDVYRHVSLHQPAFLNAHRELLFPSIPSVQQCFHSETRPSNMALYGEVEVERGRNFPHRRSLSAVELIGHEFNFEDLDLDLAGNPATGVTIPVDTNGPSPDLESQNSKKLEDFTQFLRERMIEVSASGTGAQHGHSFERLLPSRPGPDNPVSRKVAANSFAYMLQLASMGILEIDTSALAGNGHTQISAPNEVYVNFV